MRAPPHVVEPPELEPGIYSFKQLCRWTRQSGVLAAWLQGLDSSLRDDLDVLKRFEEDDNTEEAFKTISVLIKRRGKALDFRNAAAFILIGPLLTFFFAHAASKSKKINIREKRKCQTDFLELKRRLARTEKNAESLPALMQCGRITI
jgi:hypothetical protein